MKEEIKNWLKGYFKKSPYYSYKIMCEYDIEHCSDKILSLFEKFLDEQEGEIINELTYIDDRVIKDIIAFIKNGVKENK